MEVPGKWQVTRRRPTLLIVGSSHGTHLADDPPNRYRFHNNGPSSVFVTTHPDVKAGTDIITPGNSHDIYTNYAVVNLLDSTGSADGTFLNYPESEPQVRPKTPNNMADSRIAIRDDEGILRRITKIMPMSDGVAVSVPYHSAKEGWLYKFKPDYSKTESIHPLSEMEHYTASDKVKLSIHLNGFVQFSNGGGQPILSGYDSEKQSPKGIGVHAFDPVNVTSGPLFGVGIRNLTEFEELGQKQAIVFKNDDLWYHPDFPTPPSTGYNLEVFMFPNERLKDVRKIDGKPILRTYLPFNSAIRFKHELRVLELPKLQIFLGIILHRATGGTGFTLGGPSYGPPGEKVGLGAWYPKPEIPEIDEQAKSLDYRPDSPTA